MEEFWNTLREIGSDFVQNTGLAIVRTVAFLVLGLVIVKIVRIIAQSHGVQEQAGPMRRRPLSSPSSPSFCTSRSPSSL